MKVEKLKVLEVCTLTHRNTIKVFAKVNETNMHYNIIWDSYASMEHKVCYEMLGVGFKTSRQQNYTYFEPHLIRGSDAQYRKEEYQRQIKENIPTEVINFALRYLATSSTYEPWSSEQDGY